jgi:glutamate-1-semialdehyde 2,1-aminomutase
VARGAVLKSNRIQPDMITLGKNCGWRNALAAYAGKKEIMSMVSPLGGVYQAGHPFWKSARSGCRYSSFAIAG